MSKPETCPPYVKCSWEEYHQLALEAVTLKNRLFLAGLYLTGHKMDLVVKQIGWEFAEGKEVNTP